MNLLHAVLATLAGCMGGGLVYLASPQQQWLVAPLPMRYVAWLGGPSVLASLLAMCQVLAPLEAVFAWSILLMFVWSVAPFLGAWRARSYSATGPGKEDVA